MAFLSFACCNFERLSKLLLLRNNASGRKWVRGAVHSGGCLLMTLSILNFDYIDMAYASSEEEEAIHTTDIGSKVNSIDYFDTGLMSYREASLSDITGRLQRMLLGVGDDEDELYQDQIEMNEIAYTEDTDDLEMGYEDKEERSLELVDDVENVAFTPLDSEKKQLYVFNAVGREYEISVPMLFGNGSLVGEVPIRVSAGGEVFINRTAFLSKATEVLNANGLSIIKTVGNDMEYIAIRELRAAGLNLYYDNATSGIVWSVLYGQTKMQTLHLPGVERKNALPRLVTTEPELFSMSMNLRNTIVINHNSSGDDDIEYRLGFDGGLRFDDALFLYDGFLDGTGDAGIGGVHMLYDDIENRVRYRIGEISIPTRGFQGGGRILGGSASRRLGQLGYSSLGRMDDEITETFEVLRTSTVEIYAGNTLLSTQVMNPGIYNLSSLNLSSGVSDVTVVIEDSDGRKVTKDISIFKDFAPLSFGEYELDVSAGFKNEGRSGDDLFSSYNSDNGLFALSYRAGLGRVGTMSLGVQSDELVSLIDGSLAMQLPYGRFEPSVGISRRGGSEGISDDLARNGAALRLSYSADMANIFNSYSSLNNYVQVYKPSLNVNFAAKSRYFSAVNSTDQGASNLWSAAFAYSQYVAGGVSGTVSTRYNQARDVDDIDPYAATLSLSKRFDIGLSAYLNMNYGENRQGESDFSSSVNVSYDLGRGNSGRIRRSNRAFDNSGFFTGTEKNFLDAFDRTTLLVDDTGSMTTSISGSRPAEFGSLLYGFGYDSIQNSAGDGRNNSFDANLSYTGSSYAMYITHDIDDTVEGSETIDNQVSTVRFNTAIGIAGGKMAVMKPFSPESGFMIVQANDNISDKEVVIKRPSGGRYGHSGSVFPAAVGGLPSYSRSEYVFSVDDLPFGYSLGSGGASISSVPGGGYIHKLGSEASVVVVGYLRDIDSEKYLSRAFGWAYPAEYNSAGEAFNDNAVVVEVFTNARGRFVAQGVEAGAWKIDIEKISSGRGGKLRYGFSVAEGELGLVTIAVEDGLHPISWNE